MIEYFDCNSRLGRANDPKDSRIFTAAQFAEYYEYAGIKGALVFHNEALTDWRTGNDRLIREIQKYDNFIGCGVLVPSCTGETGNISVYLDYLVSNGIKAIRLFPILNNFSLKPYSVDELIKGALKHRMPILIDYINYRDTMLPYSSWDFSPDFDAIYELTASYPKAAFIVIMPGMQSQRRQFALLAETRNVILEASSFGFRNIEYICREFGYGRLAFGTYMPVLEPGSFKTYLAYADIPEDEKNAIAGGTILNMLNGVI
ncbi:MAG: hypothetical protein R3232_04650 [Clostridia bacterium]|nr:hypothetical protein [Clostridia bacterium]